MAYYYPDNYYRNDPYYDHHYFSSTPIQESTQYPVSSPESNYYEYYQTSYNNHYEHYSVHEPSDPVAPLYFPSEPTFRISYSTVELDDTDYDEYDPTPYGGGYDQATTYGKPIPPSAVTCYPRSGPQPDVVEKPSYALIPSPYGKDIDQDPPIKATSGDIVKVDSISSTSGDEEVKSGGDEREIEFLGNGDYGYEGERTQVDARMAYGSGLEAMDICEGLFGYWPCVAKKAEEERRKCYCQQEIRKVDPWGSAADYLFGSPLVYNDYGNNYLQQDQYYESWGNS